MQKDSTATPTPAQELSADETRELHRQFWKLIINSRVTRRIEKRTWHREDELEALINKGLPINEEYTNDFDEETRIETHLFACTINNDVENIRFLLAHGAAPSILHAPGNDEYPVLLSSSIKCKGTPLFWAVRANNIPILKLFLERGAHIEPDQKSGLWHAAQAFEERTSAEVIALLDKQWAKQTEHIGQSPIQGSSPAALPQDNDQPSKKEVAEQKSTEKKKVGKKKKLPFEAF